MKGKTKEWTVGAVFIALVLLFGAVPTTLWAQEITATILGTVTDVTGAAVPGAKVTITNEGTGTVRTTTTDSTGNYTVKLLPVGVYSVQVEASGFQTFQRRGIELQINQSALVNISLKPGTLLQKVTVVENVSQLQTTEATIGKVMPHMSITQLPLNGRNYIQLGVLQPGVSQITPNLSKSGSGAAADQGYAVNGLRTQANVFLIDGALNTDMFFTSSVLKPAPDSIQEFKILTNDYSAEFWGGGSVVNLVLKSGTNSYHGTAWEFLRNDIFDARNYFSPTVPPLKQNQFGVGVGGPLSIPRLYNGHNRTFFYVYYEGFRNRQGITENATVPSPLERKGDFSESSVQPIDPSTGQPFANDIVPINDLSAQLLALYPTTAGNTFSASPSQSSDNDSIGFRIDHHISESDILWGHYLYEDIRTVQPFVPFGALVPGFPGESLQKPQTINISETHTFSPNLLNQAWVSFVRLNFAAPTFTRRDKLSSFGFTYPSTAPAYETIPAIFISGLSPLGNPQGPGIRITNTYEFRDDVSYVHGRHDMKMGADFRNTRYNIAFGSNVNGQFNFTGQFTGNSLADFLLGLPSTFNQSTLASGHLHGWTYEWYFQDRFRLLSNLTLNFGVRHTMATAFAANSNELFGAFRPGMQSTIRTDAPTGLVYQGDPGVPNGTVDGDYNNFAPRVGLAWDPTGAGHFTVRAGYGIFYEYIPGIATFNAEFSSPPGFPSISVNAPSDYANPLSGISNPLAGKTITTPVQVTSMAPNVYLPYDQQWNLSLQRSIPGDILLEADYIGTHGVGLLRYRQINPAVYGPGATLQNTNARRIYAPNFASITQIENSANSHYNSLQLSANKRFSHGLSFLVSYVWSKAIDDGSYVNISQGTNAGNVNQPMDPFNLRLERGLSLYDVRNRFVASAVYQLPFGRNLSGFAGVLGKGWQATLITTLQSGTPFTVFEPRDISLTAVGADRPNVTCNPNSGPHTVAEWFDTSCFQSLDPVLNAGQYGNGGRDIVIGPPFKDLDFAVMKYFNLTEGKRLQFRSEFFNAFNHPNFDLPNGNIGTTNFGQVLGARDPRILQFALKFEF
jgi:hypothetical protein